LTLAINEFETTCDVSIAMDACKDYGQSPQEAGSSLKQVRKAVSEWRQEAGRLNIPEAEQYLMAAAFQT
jgi:hypothetical protein